MEEQLQVQVERCCRQQEQLLHIHTDVEARVGKHRVSCT